MTAPRTAPDDRSDVSPAPKRTGLSPVQVLASALAAVSAAVVASFFGVAGTLIGAGVGSVISTVGATVYSESLRRTNERLRQARTQLGTGHRPRRPGTEPVPTLPATLDPRRSPAPHRRPRSARLLASAAAVFLLAMGVLTGVELIGQRPVSALVGGAGSGDSTTVGSVTDLGGGSSTTPQPSSPATAPAAPSATGSASATPSTTASRSATASSTAAGTTPQRTATATSSTAAPSPSSAVRTPAASSTAGG